MKRKLYLSLFMLLPVPMFAQVSIQNMDKYSVGDNFRHVNCATANVSPGDTGTGHHWGYDLLTPVDTTYSMVMSPGATTFSSKFPSANLAIVNSDGRFLYYNHTPGKSYLAGFVDTNITVESSYANTILSSSRPITYGDVLNDTFTSGFIQGGATFTGGGSVKITADAEGMLHMPDMAYTDVLSVKMELFEVDSNTSGPLPVVVTTERVTYMWYHNDFKAPLLVWDSTNVTHVSNTITKAVAYLVDETLSVPTIQNKASDAIAAINKSALMVTGTFATGKQYDVAVYNLNGQKLYQSKFTGSRGQQIFDLQQEPVSGMYVVIIRDNNGSQNVIKLVKE